MSTIYAPELDVDENHYGEVNRHETAIKAVQNLGYLVLVLLVSVTLLITTFLAIQDHYRIEQNSKIQAFIKHQAIRNHRATIVNRHVQNNTQQILLRLKDCTTPGGKCYKQGQAQRASVVGNINAISFLAAACADRPGQQTVAEIRVCVEQHYKQQQ